MDKALHDGWNEHLKLEFGAAQKYLAMACWLDTSDLPGFATWMMAQSAQELTHARKFIDHLLERDLAVRIPGIDAPSSSWSDVKSCFEEVLASEQKVTASIDALYDRAVETADRPAQRLLDWFVTEQVEEENVARAILARLKLAGDSGVGLLMVDQEMASGTVPGAMDEADAGGA